MWTDKRLKISIKTSWSLLYYNKKFYRKKLTVLYCKKKISPCVKNVKLKFISSWKKIMFYQFVILYMFVRLLFDEQVLICRFICIWIAVWWVSVLCSIGLIQLTVNRAVGCVNRRKRIFLAPCFLGLELLKRMEWIFLSVKDYEKTLLSLTE